jgi:thymidylate synthase (FAD)
MTRATVPEAEHLIGVKHPVLTHGFVALVDYMGNDAAIVQAARVSYGQGTRSVRDDRGLIRYLMRHRHTTPFEMVEFKFLVRLPIFVARQWIRHRTACLAEGTRVSFDLPGGIRRRGNPLYPIEIERIWQKFQPTRHRNPQYQRNAYYRRDRVERMRVRNLDEERWVLGHSHVVGATRNGPKPVFRVTLEDGKSIECTADHRFLFREGWASLADRTGLRVQGDRAVWNDGRFELFVNGAEVARPALHHDREWLEEMLIGQQRPVRDIAEVCGVDSATIHLWARRHGLSPGRPSPSAFVTGNRFAELGESREGISVPRRVSLTDDRPYTSKQWLESRWVIQGLSAGRISKECGASSHTIRAWLRRYGLTNHPEHPTSRPFARDQTPRNRGNIYELGRRPMPVSQLAIVRRARAGPASNFWKGGLSPDRQSIGRWTTQIAPRIHELNRWTCQLCRGRRPILHAHHIVPVWADLSRARDPANLTTLCDECHREVHKDERAFVERLGGAPIVGKWRQKPLPRGSPVLVPKLVGIRSFEYLGPRMTYDLEVEGPFHNFVANGIITHNSVNEHSARYSIVPDEYELPPAEEIRLQSQRNRQGRDQPVPAEVAERFRGDLDRISKEAYAAYSRALEAGVARETARLLLPVAYYTQWYWKTNLWNLFHFLSLRLDPHAQEEIRLYAAELAKVARVVCPVAFEAFEEFQLSGITFGRREQTALHAMLEGKTPEQACQIAGLQLTREDGRPMTGGEGVEFLQKLERLRQVD